MSFQNKLITSAKTLTTSYNNLGGELDVSSYNTLILHLNIDINDSLDVSVQVLRRNASSPTLFSSTLISQGLSEVEVRKDPFAVKPNIDQKVVIPIAVTGIDFVQIQIKVNTVGSTAGQILEAIVDRGDGQIIRRDDFTKVTHEDSSGLQGFNSIFGDQMATERSDDVLVQFQYNIATDDVSTTVTNGGTVTQADSQAVVQTSTATNGTAQVQSVNSLRYRPGHDAMVYFTAAYTTGVIGATQYAGLFDDDDGFYIGYKEEDFGVNFRKATVDGTFVTQTNFNKDKLDGTGFSGFIIDPTKSNIFRINFGWLGSAPVFFFVYGGSSVGWINFHTIDFSNMQEGVSIENPVLPIRFEAIKTSGATNITMKSGSWNAGHIGGSEIVGDRFFAGSNSKLIPTSSVLTSLFTIRSKTTFQSKTNKVSALLSFLSANADGNKTVTVRVVKNATLGGTPSYADVDATNSVIEIDTAGTTVTGGTDELVIGLGRTDSVSLIDGSLGLKIEPGDTYSFAAESASTNDVTIGARWKERF